MLAFYIIVGVLALIFCGFLLVRLIWNIRLNQYQKKSGIERSKLNRMHLRSNIVSMSLLLLVGTLSIVGGTTVANKPKPVSERFTAVVIDGVKYENAKTVGSKEKLESILASIQSNYRNSGYRGGNSGLFFDMAMPMFNKTNSKDVDALPAPESTGETGGENIADTYNQVAGVTEADIAKVHESGKYLIYGPKYKDRIYKVALDESGNHTGNAHELIFEDFMYHNMILYKDKLVVFGYKITYLEQNPDSPYHYYYDSIDYSYGYWRPQKYEPAYYIVDTNSMEILKSEKLNGYLIDLRVTDGILYLFVSETIQFDDDGNVLPMDFESLYYFKGENNSLGITRIYAIDLKDPAFKTNKIGFMGQNQTLYMGNGLIVLTNYKWKYYEGQGTLWARSYNTTQVIAISYDETGNMAYVGSQEVEGYLSDQYFLDVREGMVRIVTTFGKNDSNHLYILKPNEQTDNLDIIGHLTEGLGKPGEHVKSVTFTETLAKVVTFLQTDPLYTIDLSNPSKPKIIDAIEEPGYSGVLFTWDDPNHTIGIGYMADENGRTTGIKVSAYTDSSQEPFTINFPYDECRISTEVLYNPRENLIIDRVNGIFAFIVSQRVMTEITEGSSDYYWRTVKTIFMFKVDFNSPEILVQNKTLSSTLLTIDSFDFEKIVIVNNTMHILAEKRDITWDLVNNSLNEPLYFVKNEIQ